MRILYVLHRYHTNMISTMKGWKENGNEVCVISQYKGKVEDHKYVVPHVMGYSKAFNVFFKLYVNVIKKNDPFAKDINLRYGIPPMKGIKKIIKEFNPDVIVLRERSLYTMFCYHFCKKNGYRTILYNLSPVFAEPGYYKYDLAHRLARKLTPEYRISPTRQIGIDMEGKVRDGKSFFAPFIVEPRVAPEERSYYKDGNINVFEIGKYQERKNHFLMVNVIKRLSEKYPQIKLTIAGELSDKFHQEYYDRLEKYIKEQGLEDRIILFKNLPKAEVERIYQETDLFVLTSTGEPASITVIEPMAFSVPTISGTDNGTADYIACGETGEVFMDCDEDDLYAKMDGILSEKDNIPKMGAKAYKHVCDNFQFRNYLDTIEEILADMEKKN
ncbi:glycosyltransferase family 4 protein [Butyrivibrio sp. XBB1001]|uniref:glycosyltransferase family 4 protein n=1 Tax=Butyrivibrio sp. XBB1001 TaxID=1280682 RepID=UPI00047A38B5|nr:glycosyltransferase family 4 protein [Butyrivibrio sp. XBB1001]